MTTTTYDRWKTALTEARRAGAKIRTNVQECCRGCVGWEKLGFKSEAESESTPLAWHYGGQGGRLCWDYYGNPVTVETSSRWYSSGGDNYGRAYFNHDNGGAEIIAKAMRDQGFEVDWDGSEFSCVQVIFPTDAQLKELRDAQELERELERERVVAESMTGIF